MALNNLVDSRDVRFVLFEMLEVEKLTGYRKYVEFDRETFEQTLDLAENIAVEHFYPANRDGDRIGAQYNPETKAVTYPKSFHECYKAANEAGFPNMIFEPEHGGMGLPFSIAISSLEYLGAGSLTMLMHTGLNGGAHLLLNFGSEELKKKYLPSMLAGKWAGTMCLTEPEAGSDVGALKTKAVRQQDGTYKITGQKIFISGGDHDLTENIVHIVLARIEGDPPGTKGLSIFVVPKYLANEDGSRGERNDVVCSGIEHKMGLKGSATCTLNFGDNGSCVAYLLGEERQGMKIMFQLMNEARTGTGLQALCVSSAAYMHAITYAKNRVQGVHITQMRNPDAPSVPIIEHADVRRMLLRMKGYVEGMRMLTYLLAYNLDLHKVLGGEQAKKALSLVELFVPIVKAGNSDTAWLVTAEAIQVYGGYGYCQDYPVEQFARDCKILSLYEGTNGIQSLDLALRKILFNPEMYNLTRWKELADETFAKAKGVVDEMYIDLVRRGMDKMFEVVELYKAELAEMKIMEIVSSTTKFQQAFFLLVLAWLHLWSLTVSVPKMKELTGSAEGQEKKKLLEENGEAAYYTGRVLSSRHFISTEFPQFFGKMDGILNRDMAVLEAEAPVFTGAPEE